MKDKNKEEEPTLKEMIELSKELGLDGLTTEQLIAQSKEAEEARKKAGTVVHISAHLTPRHATKVQFSTDVFDADGSPIQSFWCDTILYERTDLSVYLRRLAKQLDEKAPLLLRLASRTGK
jgi:hypothetical protein